MTAENDVLSRPGRKSETNRKVETEGRRGGEPYTKWREKKDAGEDTKIKEKEAV